MGRIEANSILWEKIVDELQLVTNLDGYSEETLRNVLYARTGSYTLEEEDE